MTNNVNNIIINVISQGFKVNTFGVTQVNRGGTAEKMNLAMSRETRVF